MALTSFSLLAVAGAIALLWILSIGSVRVGRIRTRLAIKGFDRFESGAQRRLSRQKTLRSAHIPTNYRQYAAETRFTSVLAGVVAGIVGVYVLWGVFALLSIPETTAAKYVPAQFGFVTGLFGVVPPSGVVLFAYHATVALAFGVGTALLVYVLRWYYPRYVAGERERQIDMTLPMTVSFFYALSRSGMSFPKMMRILADNDEVYGDAAEEVGVAVRNIEMFGMDVVTSVQTMARRSPSSQFREFSENLASVLQTGGSLSEFLHREYEDFREEAESQQERLLELIETLAEAYVTLAVAGTLFLIVILTVMSIAVSDTLPLIQLIVYAVIPLGNLAFIVYLGTVVDNLSARDPSDDETDLDKAPEGVRRRSDLAVEAGNAPQRMPDGGDRANDPDRVRKNLQRLAAYKQWREVRQRVEGPLRTIFDRPTALLWVTFPLAVFMIGIRIPGRLADGVLTLAEFDDLVIQSLLVLLGTFAIAYEVHRRRVDAIESAIPDFLDRLASLNEAGMTVVTSLDRIRETELGALDDELEIVWRDIKWGADVETAFKRFENRVRTKTVSRIVTLTTEAMKASGNLGTVLRIAANQAKADRRLKRKRRQEMFTYVVVVYVAFLVFLFIVGVLNNLLLPSLPDAGTAANLTSGSGRAAQSFSSLERLGNLDKDAYRLTFLHAAVVQGLFSGAIAGQLSTGDIRSGAKHATVLITLAYVVFVAFL